MKEPAAATASKVAANASAVLQPLPGVLLSSTEQKLDVARARLLLADGKEIAVLWVTTEEWKTPLLILNDA